MMAPPIERWRLQGGSSRKASACTGSNGGAASPETWPSSQQGRLHSVAGCRRSSRSRQDRPADGVAASDESKRLLLSSAWGRFIYRHYRAEFIPTALWCDLSPVEWLLRKMGDNLFMQTASWLVSRELTEAAGPWDTRLLSDDDGEYFCRVVLASEGVRFVPEAKVYYRGPGVAFGSLSYIGRSDRKLEAFWLSMQLHVGYLRSLEDSERVREACLSYLRTSLIHFYPERSTSLRKRTRLAGIWEDNSEPRACPGSTPGSKRSLAGGLRKVRNNSS